MENLSSIFFYNLDKAIKAYRQYAQSVHKLNGFQITIDQWLVLKSIEQNPRITHSEICETVFKDKASVTRIMDVLTKEKYLHRDIHPESGRRKQLTVTAKGRKLLAQIRPFVLKNRKHALRNISDHELKITESVLKKISSNCINK